MLALAEEVMKFLAMKRVIKDRPSSWLEVTVFMTLSGLGFEVIEAIPYAIGSGAAPMLVRGVTMMHAAFGFVTGYFYGKGLQTGNKVTAMTGLGKKL